LLRAAIGKTFGTSINRSSRINQMVMKAVLRVFAILIVGSNLSSCGPVLYSNVGQNVPMFQEKGEFSGQFGFSSTDGAYSAKGPGGKAAYAVSDKFHVMGSFYAMENTTNSDMDEWEGKGSYWEFGTGLYGGFKKPRFRYEAVLGFGKGRIENTSLITSGNYINSTFIKPFVQPSWGFVSRFFEIAFTPRIAFLSFQNTQDYQLLPQQRLDAMKFYDQRSNNLVLEPGLTLRGGYETLMLDLQYSFSTLQEVSQEFFVINDEHFSIGLRFLIPDRKYAKKKP
jgi:hypothetical protein